MKKREGLLFHNKGKERTSTGRRVWSGRICSEKVSTAGPSSFASRSLPSSERRCGGRTWSTPKERRSSRVIWYLATAAGLASMTRFDSQSSTNMGHGADSINCLHISAGQGEQSCVSPNRLTESCDEGGPFMPYHSPQRTSEKKTAMPYGKI